MADAESIEDLPTTPALLELVLRIQGDFRGSLKPLGVTPLQAAVLSYLKDHPNSRLSPIAEPLSLEPPTVFEVVQDLIRKRWVSNRRSAQDRRALSLRLTRQGERSSKVSPRQSGTLRPGSRKGSEARWE
ncbi:MAG: MarR family transcriptional regulator [Nitrospirota bacterium]